MRKQGASRKRVALSGPVSRSPWHVHVAFPDGVTTACPVAFTVPKSVMTRHVVSPCVAPPPGGGSAPAVLVTPTASTEAARACRGCAYDEASLEASSHIGRPRANHPPVAAVKSRLLRRLVSFR